MLLVGRFLYKFVVAFGQQFFLIISLEAASSIVVAQIVSFYQLVQFFPMRYPLHLTCIQDEHLNM